MADSKAQITTPAASLGVSQLRPGTVQVALDTRVSADELHKVLDQVLALGGCTGCGLNGLDILLRGVDPQTVEPFRETPAVRDVTVVR